MILAKNPFLVRKQIFKQFESLRMKTQLGSPHCYRIAVAYGVLMILSKNFLLNF